MLRKIIRFTLVFLLILVASAFALPFLFKKQIIAAVHSEVNKNLRATVRFDDVDISFFRQFPRVAVALEDLHITGTGAFAGDTLLQAPRLDAAVNLMSFFRGSDYLVYSLEATSPDIYAHVLPDGRANWDILLPDTSSATSTDTASAYHLNLQRYAFSDGHIRYKDESMGLFTELRGLDHEGSGNLNAERFLLETRTEADQVFLEYGGIPYFNGVHSTVKANFDIDQRSATINFNKGAIQINELALQTAGSFRLIDDSTYGMDISFNAPSTDFKHILSLIPALYQNDFASVKTSGTAIFEGFVKGRYSNMEMPGYGLKMEVQNGSFQYPDLPQPVRNIQLSLQVANPDGITDHTVVQMKRAHAEVNGAPVDMHLELKTPVSDPFIDAGIKGKLDLAQLGSWFKLEKGTRLRGLLDADLTMRGNTSKLDKGLYDQFYTAGKIKLQDFFYAAANDAVGNSLQLLDAEFEPRQVSINQLKGNYNGTSYDAKGSIGNPLGYMLRNRELTGDLFVKAGKLNLDDYLGTDTVAANASKEAVAAALPFQVPARMRFQIRTSIDELHYDKVDMKNISGSCNLANETISLQDLRGEALDGKVMVNGSYSTLHDKQRPDISLRYDVQGLNVQKTFLAFNTVQKLMPIGRFIDGKMNSSMSVSGKLGSDMMPDLNSLSGNGDLLLIEGFLRRFGPVDEMARVLNVSALKDLSLKEVKNYVAFANGRMMVKPFTVKVKDIDMEIGGTHGFDQSMQYRINMKLPRHLMGSSGNSFISNLEARAASNGVPLKAGETVNLNVDLGGSIMRPTVKTDLRASGTSLAMDMKEQVKDFAKARVDTAKKMIRDSATALKKEIINSAKAAILQQVIPGKDSSGATAPGDLRKKAEATGKAVLGNLFGKKKKDTASRQ